jgi:hypothetical protein
LSNVVSALKYDANAVYTPPAAAATPTKIEFPSVSAPSTSVAAKAASVFTQLSTPAPTPTVVATKTISFESPAAAPVTTTPLTIDKVDSVIKALAAAGGAGQVAPTSAATKTISFTPSSITTTTLKANADGKVSLLDAANAVAEALYGKGFKTSDYIKALELVKGLADKNNMINATAIAGLNSNLRIQSDDWSGFSTGDDAKDQAMGVGKYASKSGSTKSAGDVAGTTTASDKKTTTTTTTASKTTTAQDALNKALAAKANGSTEKAKSSNGSTEKAKSSYTSPAEQALADLAKKGGVSGVSTGLIKDSSLVAQGTQITIDGVKVTKGAGNTWVAVTKDGPVSFTSKTVPTSLAGVSSGQGSVSTTVKSTASTTTASKSDFVQVKLSADSAPVSVDKTIYNALKSTGYTDSQIAGSLGSGKMGIVETKNGNIGLAYKSDNPDAVMADSGLFKSEPYKTLTSSSGASVPVTEWAYRKLDYLGLTDKEIAAQGQDTLTKIATLDVGSTPKSGSSGTVDTIKTAGGTLLQVPDERLVESGLFTMKGLTKAEAEALKVNPTSDPLGAVSSFGQSIYSTLFKPQYENGYKLEPTVTGILEMNKVASSLASSGKSLSDVKSIGSLDSYEVLKNVLTYADAGTVASIAKSNPRLILGAATDKTIQPVLESRLGTDVYEKTLDTAMTSKEKAFVDRQPDKSTAIANLATQVSGTGSKDLEQYGKAQITALAESVVGPLTPNPTLNALLFVPLTVGTGPLKVFGKLGEIIDLVKAADGTIDAYKGSELIGKAGAVAGDASKLRIAAKDGSVIDILTEGNTLSASTVKSAGITATKTGDNLYTTSDGIQVTAKTEAEALKSAEDIRAFTKATTPVSETQAKLDSVVAALKSSENKVDTSYTIDKTISFKTAEAAPSGKLEFKTVKPEEAAKMTAAVSPTGKTVLESKTLSDGRTISKTSFKFKDSNGVERTAEQFEIRNADGSTTVTDASSFEDAERAITQQQEIVRTQLTTDVKTGLGAQVKGNGVYEVFDGYGTRVQIKASSGEEAIQRIASGEQGTPVTKAMSETGQDFTPKLDELSAEHQPGGGGEGGEGGYGGGESSGGSAAPADVTQSTYNKDWGTNLKYENGVWKFEDPKNPGSWYTQSDYEALLAKRAAEDAAKVSTTPTYNTDWKTNVKLDTDGKTWLFEDVENPGTYLKQADYENLLTTRADARSPKYNAELGTYTMTDKNGVTKYLDQSTGYYVSKTDYDAIVAAKVAADKAYADAVAAAKASSQPESVVISQGTSGTTSSLYSNTETASNTIEATGVSDAVITRIQDLVQLDDEVLLTRYAGETDDPVKLMQHSADLYALAAKKNAMGAASTETANILNAARDAKSAAQKLLEAC